MLYEIPSKWKRLGLVLARDKFAGTSSVAGDPCLVRDDALPGWRMVLFYNSGSYGKEQIYVKLSE